MKMHRASFRSLKNDQRYTFFDQHLVEMLTIQITLDSQYLIGIAGT